MTVAFIETVLFATSLSIVTGYVNEKGINPSLSVSWTRNLFSPVLSIFVITGCKEANLSISVKESNMKSGDLWREKDKIIPHKFLKDFLVVLNFYIRNLFFL